MNDDNKNNSEVTQIEYMLMEMMIRISTLEKLFIEKNIITSEELVAANLAEGKELAEKLQLEVEKMIDSIPQNK